MKQHTPNIIRYIIKVACYILIPVFCVLQSRDLFSQGVSINNSGTAADSSAMLDVSSITKGTLLTRMTTAQRNAIVNPAQSLLIFNTTTHCFEYYDYGIWQSMFCSTCPVPSAVSATATPNPLCAGGTLTLNGNASGAITWNWAGPNGFTSTLQNPFISTIATAGSGLYTLTAGNACGSSAPVTTASVTVLTIPTSVSATVTPNPVCDGGTLTLTANALSASSWSWTGPNGFNAAIQNPVIGGITTAGAGIYTLTVSNACGTATAVNTAALTVNTPPTAANAGSDINPSCGVTTATLAANTPVIGTGTWSVVSGAATITTPGSPISGVTGLSVPGTAVLRWTISNAPCTASTDDVVITTTTCGVVCGNNITVNHIAGTLAPVTKTVTYGTVTNIPGAPTKCWITRNLGAGNQASSVSDATESAAGWYWQFNRKQGYKHDGSTRTPATTWITPIVETSDWIAANDPCTIELGSGWRLPTSAEWTSVDASGGWTDWNGPWSSALKLHASGYLMNSDGSLSSRGTGGVFSCSDQANTTDQPYFYFSSSSSQMFPGAVKAYAFAIRCLKD